MFLRRQGATGFSPHEQETGAEQRDFPGQRDFKEWSCVGGGHEGERNMKKIFFRHWPNGWPDPNAAIGTESC